MEDEKQAENDRQRAEVFDALGHPTRILILKALSEEALGFADIKRKTAIESSGHLQHHLSKLDGLIKTDEYGKYCLSDQGKDALLTVQTVENASPKPRGEEKASSLRFNGRAGLKGVAFLLAALLIVSSAAASYEYNQVAMLRRETTFPNGLTPDAASYYSQFASVVPNSTTSSAFAPPVSMYKALTIGLNADGWNKTALQGLTIMINLMQWETFTNATSSNNVSESIGPVTTPSASYSTVNINGVIYRYVWLITIYKLGPPTVTYETILIDSSTGQIIRNAPFVFY